jgi:hypothetical protein
MCTIASLTNFLEALMKGFIYSALSVLATANHAGIARYDFKGVVTDSSFDIARADLIRAETARPDGFISVFTDAVLAVSSDDWHTKAGGQAAWTPPGALLVRPENLETAERYAKELCTMGYQRRAFTCEDAALAWVQKHAEIRQNYAAWLATRLLARLR